MEQNIAWFQVDAEKSLQETLQNVSHVASQYRYRRLVSMHYNAKLNITEEKPLLDSLPTRVC